MKRWLPVFGFALLLPLAGAQAATPAELFKSKNCVMCHNVDKKVVGPSYKEVAAKYKGDKTAADKLATKIKNGGSGVWGGVMPPNPVTEAEAKQLAEWVLTQK